MSNGLYSGVSGLALGVGLYKDVSGLWSGANGLISGFGGDGSTLSPNFINAVYEAAMTAYNFQQLINFTRTSSATFVGSNGLIQNTPQSRNLLTFTQQFDNATAWVSNLSGTGVAPTVTANDGIAPDGTPTADRLQFSLGGGTASGDVTRRRQVITTPATLQTFSMYLRSYDGVSTYNMHLVDAAGTTRNIVVTGAWQRFEVTATAPGTSTTFAVGLRGAQTPANSNTADVLAWGAQVEEAATASTYTRNVGGLFPPRFDYDPITLQPRGILIEEQRTNLLTYSAQFNDAVWVKANVTVTPDTTIAPDGTLTGDTITGVIPGANNSVHQVYVSAGQVLTYTIRVRAGTATTCGLLLRDNTGNTNLAVSASILSGPGAVSGASVLAVSGLSTTEWTTVALTTTAATISGNQIRAFFYPETATAAATTGKSNVVWGAQLEAGAFTTSYIPTVASQVTRTADQASIEAPMFAPWYNATEGTLVAAFTFLASTLSGTTPVAYNGNANGRWAFASAASMRMSDGTNTVTAGSITDPAAVNKTASALSPGGLAISLNGAAPGTSPYVGTFGSQASLSIGGGAGAFINGHIRSIKYYPTRLSNAQLQALSV